MLLKIGDDPAKINKKAGFKKYGNVKNPYIIMKGSIAGPNRRLIVFTKAIRPNNKIPKEVPAINKIY